MAQQQNINTAILGTLQNIESLLETGEVRGQKLETDLAGMSETGVVGASEWKDFSKFFGEMAKGISALVKSAEKMSPKAAKNIKSLLVGIGEAIQGFFEEVSVKEAQTFTMLLKGLASNILKFAISIVIAIPFLLIAPIGALLFGFTFVGSYLMILVLFFMGHDISEAQEIVRTFKIDLICLTIIAFYFGGGAFEGVIGKKTSK